MLAINNVEVVYDNVVLVLKGISLSAKQRTITTLLGANGAGKTTTLKAISGILHAERGQVTRGTIEFNGARLDRLAPHEVVRCGVAQVFEGRRVFENLTVEENLVAGGHLQNSGRQSTPAWTTFISSFRGCTSVATRSPDISRAASSRCW